MSDNITANTTTTGVAIGDIAIDDGGDAAWRVSTNEYDPDTNEETEIREIPLDLFRNMEVKYPKDAEHLLETHPYFEVFSPNVYVEIRERTSEMIRSIQLKKWCLKYNHIRGTMQEGAKYAVDARAHKIALRCGVTIGGQSPTGIRDVLEVLSGEEMWIGDQLSVTRQFVFRLKFDQEGDEWMTATRQAEKGG